MLSATPSQRCGWAALHPAFRHGNAVDGTTCWRAALAKQYVLLQQCYSFLAVLRMQHVAQCVLLCQIFGGMIMRMQQKQTRFPAASCKLSRVGF